MNLVGLLLLPRRKGAVSVRLKRFGGRDLLLRRGSSDLEVLIVSLRDQYHLPPRDPERRPIRTIWDIGANVGITTVDLACRHPWAKVVAVEVDRGNLDICRTNTQGFGDRVEVIWGAAGHPGESVEYGRKPGDEQSSSVLHSPDSFLVEKAPGLDLDDLMNNFGGEVDYVKLDIEGSEEPLLREAGSWLSRVRMLKVECHGDFDVESAEKALQDAGFITSKDQDHWATVVAFRFRGEPSAEDVRNLL